MTAAVTPTSKRDYLAYLAGATPDQLIDEVTNMSLIELYELPRELVESWPGDANTPGTARFLRAGRLTSRSEQCEATWVIADIARAANVRKDAVGRWRSHFNNGVQDVTRALVDPDASPGPIKKPGETRHPGGVPLWKMTTALHWLRKAKKITDDLYPHARKRGGGIPPGRPAKER